MLLCDSFAAFAEFGRNFIRECTKDGPAATTARGQNGGRNQRLREDQKATARKLWSDGHGIREISQLLGNGKLVSRQTAYRAVE
jgi:DNA invertase Pin-like site-specific DNA recombinase